MKLFNRYNQKSYTDQQIELPFELYCNLNQSMYSHSCTTDDNMDILSQISSQISEHSAAKGSQYSSAFSRMNSGGGDVTKQQDKFQEMGLRDQMLSINTLKKSENMMCLEFDFDDIPQESEGEMVDGKPVKLNKKFSVIN